jgi:hypothetical protein
MSTDTREAESKTKPTIRVTILVNNRPVRLFGSEVTGAEIKRAAGLPAEFKLYDPTGHQVDDEERVHVRSGEHFTAISGQDVS